MHQLSCFTTTIVEIAVELANQVLNSTFSQHNLEKPSFFFPVIFFCFQNHIRSASLWAFWGGGHYRCTMQLGCKQWVVYSYAPENYPQKSNIDTKNELSLGLYRMNHGSPVIREAMNLRIEWLPPRKLTWLAWTSPLLVGDTWYIFKWLFFHCHVSCQGCNVPVAAGKWTNWLGCKASWVTLKIDFKDVFDFSTWQFVTICNLVIFEDYI